MSQSGSDIETDNLGCYAVIYYNAVYYKVPLRSPINNTGFDINYLQLSNNVVKAESALFVTSG